MTQSSSLKTDLSTTQSRSMSEIGIQVDKKSHPAVQQTLKQLQYKNKQWLNGTGDHVFFNVHHVKMPKNLEHKKTEQFKTFNTNLDEILMFIQNKSHSNHGQSIYANTQNVGIDNAAHVESKNDSSKDIKSILSFVFSEDLKKELLKQNKSRNLYDKQRLSLHVKQNDIEVVICGSFNFDSHESFFTIDKQAFLYIVTKEGTMSFHKPPKSSCFACVDQIDEKFLSHTGLLLKQTSTSTICIDPQQQLFADHEIFRLIRSDKTVSEIAKSKCPEMVEKIQNSDHILGIMDKYIIEQHPAYDELVIPYELDQNKGQHIKRGNAKPIILKLPRNTIHELYQANNNKNHILKNVILITTLSSCIAIGSLSMAAVLVLLPLMPECLFILTSILGLACLCITSGLSVFGAILMPHIYFSLKDFIKASFYNFDSQS